MSKLFYTLVIILLLSIVWCTKGDAPPEPEYLVENIIIEASCISDCLIPASSMQGAQVFLPPYYNGYKDRRYPVVYFIHGFSGYYKTDYGILEFAYDERENANQYRIKVSVVGRAYQTPIRK